MASIILRRDFAGLEIDAYASRPEQGAGLNNTLAVTRGDAFPEHAATALERLVRRTVYTTRTQETSIMTDLTTHAILEHNFLFRGLPAATINALANLAHRKSVGKEALVFCQGDDGDALYGIASGRVRIFAADDRGHEVFLNILGPGDTFGEIALLDGLPRTASALTLAPSVLVILPRPQFLAHLEQDPGLAVHLMKLLCGRLRWVSDLVEESAFLAGPARVAKRLASLVETQGRPAAAGGVEVVMSQADLGRFLGISRQVINQYLRNWCEQGWVELKRGRIVVHDVDALTDIATKSA